MRRIGIPLALALLCGVTAHAAKQQALPRWLAGAWIEEKGDRWTEEYWTPPRANSMIGIGRNGAGEKQQSWESMRIVKGVDGSIAFHGAPDGRATVVFPLLSQTDGEIVFANPAHDYPQRIRYWREGDRLMAEIALINGGRAMRWTYARAKALGTPEERGKFLPKLRDDN